MRTWAGVTVAGLGVLRTLLGVVAVAGPSTAVRPWVGASANRTALAVLGRAAGARDVSLGAGAVLAWARGDDAALRTWTRAGVFSDALDAATTLAAWRELPPRGRMVVGAASVGAVVVGGLGSCLLGVGDR